MSILTVNGVSLPDPATLTYGINDIDSAETGRNAEGTMIRDRVGSKVKLQCSWHALTPTQISTILNAIDDESFSMTYPDAKAGANVTKTFYVGDRSTPAYSLQTNGLYLWQGLTCNFIEF